MKSFDSFISHLKTLISIKSVYSTPSKGKPFGDGAYSALEYFLSIASSFGFETVNHGGYIGEISFGEGEEIGIIGHLDVVPTGIGWNTDPFTLTEKDGVYYGRGIQDNKGPILLCLYALKELKDSGKKPNKKFRLFVGCDEETGWRDVKYFSKISNFPDFGFSPDGNFPLSYAEKGITVVDFFLPKLKNFYDVSGGTVVNAVCDYVQATPLEKTVDLSLLEKYNLKLENGIIKSYGKAAHGSTPHLGKNAIKPLFEYFLSVGEDVKNVIDCLFNDTHGLFKVKTEQGNITISPNLIKEEAGKIIISCDLRTPYPITLEEVCLILDKFNIEYKTTVRHQTQWVEKDGPFVNTLINAYNKATGENAEPISIGGSTFARAFKKGCAFGPELLGRNGNIHDANENMSKNDLLLCYKIYKTAIFDLSDN